MARKYTRARSRRQQRHSASRSASHKSDKRGGDARQEILWLGVPSVPNPLTPRRDFQALGLEGSEFRFVDGVWVRCHDPEEYADWLEAEARRRNWFLDEVLRQGRQLQMRRPAATPFEVLTTDCAPWLSDWILARLTENGDVCAKLAAIRDGWLKVVLPGLRAKRYLLGLSLHCDTDDLHFDLAVSRQDGNGRRIGRAGLQLVGPWCVGVDRQMRAGASISKAKAAQFARALANFQRRYNGGTPFDLFLSRALDDAADAALGSELAPLRENYARLVPLLEAENLKAKLRELDLKKQALLQELAAQKQPKQLPSLEEIAERLLGQNADDQQTPLPEGL